MNSRLLSNNTLWMNNKIYRNRIEKNIRSEHDMEGKIDPCYQLKKHLLIFDFDHSEVSQLSNQETYHHRGKRCTRICRS